MELAGSNYLYTLALLSISYVGFTALIVIFRQAKGVQMTLLDGFIIRGFVQIGFMAMIGAMLPPLLALFGIQPTTIWRVASAIMAVVVGIWIASFPARRHAVSPIAIPPTIWAGLAFFGIVELVLLSNIIERWGEFSTGIYCLGVTGILLAGIMFFLFSLILFFGAHPIDSVPDKAPAPEKARRHARGRGR